MEIIDVAQLMVKAEENKMRREELDSTGSLYKI